MIKESSIITQRTIITSFSAEVLQIAVKNFERVIKQI
jgi:hypothetical protein